MIFQTDQVQDQQSTNGKATFFGIPCEGCTKRKEALESMIGSTDLVIYAVVAFCIAGILILKHYQFKAE